MIDFTNKCDGGSDALPFTGGAGEPPQPSGALSFAPESPNSGFRVDETGLYYAVGPKDEGTWICTPLFLDAQTRDDSNHGWGRLLRWIDPEGKEHIWLMPMSMLAGDITAVVSRLLDGGLRLAAGRQARELLVEFLQQSVAKTIRIVTKTGWSNGQFVLPDEVFATEGSEETRYYAPDPNRISGMSTSGSLESWQDSVASRCVGNSRLIVAISTCLAGPLLEIAGEQGGGIQFTGTTSDGKTTAAKVGNSVLGSVKLIRPWRATANGLEGTAATCNHLTLVLDETAQLDPKEIGNVSYLLSNGEGKQRADSTGSARPCKRWLLLYLSTGEVTFAEHADSVGMQLKGGAEVRCLHIPSDTGAGHGIFENLHGAKDGRQFSELLAQAVEANYGYPLRVWLRWLVDHRAEVESSIRRRIDEFVLRNAKGAVPEVQRAAKRFGLIAAAGELATQAGITGWPAGEAESGAEKCFHDFLKMRGSDGNSDTDKAIARIFALIEEYGDSRFVDLDGDRNQRVHQRAGFRQANKDDNVVYYFLKSAFEKQCKGANLKQVASALADRGLLLHDHDRWTKKKRLPGFSNPQDTYAVVFEMDGDETEQVL